MKQLLAIIGIIGTFVFAGGDGFAEGLTWSEPDIINGYAYVDNGSDESNPRVAADGAGRMVSIWNTHSGGINGAISADNGATWSGLSLPGDATNANAFDGAVVYAGNGTWVIMWIAADVPGEEGLSVYITRSVDNAETWTPTALAAPATGDTGFIADIDSNKAGTIIVIANLSVMRSTDFGQSWTQIGNNESRRSYIAYAEGTTWYRTHSTYALVNFSPYYRFVFYKSNDNGATWVEQYSNNSLLYYLSAGGLETGGNQIVMPVVRQSNSGYMVEIHTSSDAGVTWNISQTLQMPGENQREAQILLERNGSNWLLYIPQDGNHKIYRSSDPTTIWTAGATVPGHNPSNGMITFAPSGAADFTSLYITNDMIESAIAPDKDIVARKSASGVASWSDAVYVNPAAEVDLPAIDDYNLRMAAGDNGTVIGIWTARVNDGVTWPDDTIEKMIGRSNDHGRTWPVQGQPLKNLIDDEFSTYTRMYFDVGYLGGESFILFTDVGIYNVSHDNGMTWNRSQQVRGLERFATNPYGFAPTGTIMCTVYAESDETSGQMRYFTITSTDYGTTWQQPVEVPAAPYVYIHTGGSSWLAKADNDLVYISDDNGQTWDVREQSWDQHGSIARRSQLGSDENGIVVANYLLYGDSLYSRTSVDGGRTWTDPILIESRSTDNSYNHQIASIGDSRWIAVWQTLGEASLAYAISEDNGLTWSTPAMLSSSNSRNVRSLELLLVSGGLVSVAWTSDLDSNATQSPLGTDSDLLFSWSADFIPVTAAEDWSLYH